MKLISLSFNNHHSSLTFLKDGKVVEHVISERITRKKHEYKINSTFEIFTSNLKEKYDHLSAIIFSNEDGAYSKLHLEELIDFLNENNNFLPKDKFLFVNPENHHLSHAYSGFYTSNFDDALCFIFDGDGSSFYNLIPNEVCLERETIFLFKDGKCTNTPLHKKYRILQERYLTHEGYKNDNTADDVILDDGFIATKIYSIGNKFEQLSVECGFSWQDSGKITGLAQYKNHIDKLPEEYNIKFWKEKVEESYNLQISSKNYIANLIRKYHKETGINNIVISGGVGLNCVINYHLIKEFPELNFHIDPVCSDAGISLGNALYEYVKKTNLKPEKVTTTYLGYTKNTYDLSSFNNLIISKVKYEDVVDILIGGNLVALFQGRSEIGQRSLGNRSLLFDPRIKNGKEIVNKIKKRESFRPFAASILLEYANEWFDLKTLKESPYMSFAIDAYEKTMEKVPSVIHADGTSRIQTVTKKQNYHFSNLIETFYKKTDVPMLLNTSFNLAGEPLVETLEDAINVISRSEIEYLYLPEIETLVMLK